MCPFPSVWCYKAKAVEMARRDARDAPAAPEANALASSETLGASLGQEVFHVSRADNVGEMGASLQRIILSVLWSRYPGEKKRKPRAGSEIITRENRAACQ